MGHTDYTITLAEAIENSEMPDEVFCYEGTTKNLKGLDEPCVIHAPTTSGMRQVIMNPVKLHVAIIKGSNKAAKAKVALPAIRIDGIGGERPVVPISLITAMELSNLVQGAAEVLDANVEHLPHNIQDLK